MYFIKLLNRSSLLLLNLGLFFIVHSWSVVGQDDTKESSDAAKDSSKLKAFHEVINGNVITSKGLFTAHRVDDKLYYEIPTDRLDQDFLWVTQISETTAGSSYAGMPAGNRIVRWEKRGDRILLRNVSYDIRAETDDSIALGVKASNLAPIIRSFDVATYSKDWSSVIDVTSLFTQDVPEFSAKTSLGVGGMDEKRTFIEEVKAFPENINVKVLATYNPEGPQRSSGITAQIHHSMVQLPERPMKPRIEDDRVGFFSVGFDDYADNENHEVDEVSYITRWRLEKKDPDKEVSEPIKPIVFYVGRETPEKWKPYVKAGIEQWQPAFEAAGFKNAILGKYPPTVEEDPDWDAEDARISSIRWLPSSIANAFGPHVHDPRTGEILEADVRMFHNVQKLVRDWYFVQASPNDERAQKFPMPDDLVGELIQFVVAHEVGHSLGYPHNMKASSTYTVEQLRDPEWTKKNGTAPSIMDYARFNYVAQPGDGAALMPQIGPYDFFVTKWGYTQFPEGVDEKAALEELAKTQIDNPMHRFGGPNPSLDSTQQTEDLGSDAVEATRLGMANLDRVSNFIVTATSEEGKNYDLLVNMYDALWAQWSREMGHVVNVIGGVEQVNLFYGDADKRFFPNKPEYQRRALDYLLNQAFRLGDFMVKQNILDRISAEGVADKVIGAQRQLLTSLVSTARINRISSIANRGGEDVFLPEELFESLRSGLFSEFVEGDSVGLYRRNLQRFYIDHLKGFIVDPATNSDLPALARAELMSLMGIIGASVYEEMPLQSAHQADLLERIRRALYPDKSN